jgi:hypothetical protein
MHRHLTALLFAAMMTLTGYHAGAVSLVKNYAGFSRHEASKTIRLPLRCRNFHSGVFTTGQMAVKPYVCVDREAGYIYTSWREFQESNDNAFAKTQRRYSRRGIPGKRITVASLYSLIVYLPFLSQVHSIEYMDAQLLPPPSADLQLSSYIHARFSTADPVMNV